MAQLRQQAGVPRPELDEPARHRLSAVAERALRDAGVSAPPTPLEEVARVAGIERIADTAELPDEIQAEKPPAWKRILGAVLFKERTVFIDKEGTAQRLGRGRFVQAHETAHVLLPWHEAVFLLDDERRIFYDTHEELETEANWVAAQLLFQGRRYHDHALDDEISLATPIDLAREYQASIHASIRYYAEHHPQAVAVLVAGRYEQFDGTVPIWESFESRSFAERFGRFSDQLPRGSLNIRDPQSPWGQIAKAALEGEDLPSERVSLIDFTGHERKMRAEAFFNQYTVFIMVSPRGVARAGRRTRVVSG
jgi:hypothetical protein